MAASSGRAGLPLLAGRQLLPEARYQGHVAEVLRGTDEVQDVGTRAGLDVQPGALGLRLLGCDRAAAVTCSRARRRATWGAVRGLELLHGYALRSFGWTLVERHLRQIDKSAVARIMRFRWILGTGEKFTRIDHLLLLSIVHTFYRSWVIGSVRTNNEDSLARTLLLMGNQLYFTSVLWQFRSYNFVLCSRHLLIYTIFKAIQWHSSIRLG
jgi:hypothetical protein